MKVSSLKYCIISFFLSTCLISQETHSFEELFRHPLSLQECQKIALYHNRQVQIEAETAIQTLYRYRQSYSKWAPQIQASGGYQKYEKNSLMSYDDNFTAQVGLTQQLFNTEDYYHVKISKQDLELARYRLMEKINQIYLEVIKQYYRIVLLKEKIQVQKANIDLLIEGYQDEKNRFEVGKSTLFEVNESKVKVANQLPLYYQDQANLKEAYHNLLLLLGYDPQQVKQLEISATSIPIEEVEKIDQKLKNLQDINIDILDAHSNAIEDLISSSYLDIPLFDSAEIGYWETETLLHQPTLLQDATKILKTKMQICQKQLENLPTLSGSASYIHTSQRMARSYDWQYGVTVNLNIFQGGKNYFQTRELERVLKSNQVGYEKNKEQAIVDVNNQIAILEKAFLTFYAAKQTVFLAEEAVQEAKDRLNHGMMTPLEYRDSVYSLTQSKNTFNQAKYDLLVAYHTLRFISGLDVDKSFAIDMINYYYK